jgi:hypothetical protein
VRWSIGKLSRIQFLTRDFIATLQMALVVESEYGNISLWMWEFDVYRERGFFEEIKLHIFENKFRWKIFT